MDRQRGYRRILVPIDHNAESERAMDVACRLATDHGASVIAVRVVEVPPLLPIEAHMHEEEVHAHRLLERARAIADSYGVGISTLAPCGRDPAKVIVEHAATRRADLVVIGAPRKEHVRNGAAVFGKTVEHVLKKARCRVMVIGAARTPAKAIRAAA
jgi:nucleotide-binding universal stress UspA family protein